jgi:hypothetical protein
MIPEVFSTNHEKERCIWVTPGVENASLPPLAEGEVSRPERAVYNGQFSDIEISNLQQSFDKDLHQIVVFSM